MVERQVSFSQRITYTYDASGNRLTELDEHSYGQWVVDYRLTYAYDANGRQLSELWEDWSNGQWVNGARWTYTYDANGHQLSMLGEVWLNSQWVNDARWTYTYDANGHQLSGLGEGCWNGQWVNSSLWNRTYDVEGNLTSFGNYYWMNSIWTPDDIGLEGTRGGNSFISDSAGNKYSYVGYYFTFTRKLLVTGIASQGGNVPAVYSLSQNYPNPFNPSTTIKYELPKSSVVSLTVYDILGRQVSVLVNDRRDAGVHEVKFDGSYLASGVYFYRLQAGGFVQAKKLMILK